MPAQGEVGIDPLFQRGQPQLLQAGCLGLGEGLVDEVGQRVTPPQPQALAQGGRRRRRIACGQRPAALAGEPLEAQGVDAVGIDGEEVAGLTGEQETGPGARRPSRLQGGAEVGDVGVERGRGGGWCVLAPHHLHEPLPRDNLVGVEHQLGQKGALLGRADLHRDAGVENLQHPEDTELQWRLPCAG